MKIFRVKYHHVWSGKKWSQCFVAAEDFNAAQKKVKQLIENNWDIAEYLDFQWCVEDHNQSNIDSSSKFTEVNS